MNAATICSYVRDIMDTYRERNPFRLCEDMDILLNRYPMGGDVSSCKGFYSQHFGIKVITVNSDQPEYIQKIVCAHEIGHSVLHSDIMEACHIETFDMSTKTEREANLFAVEYLIPDTKVTEHLDECESVYSLAQITEYPLDFLLYKIQILKTKGLKIPFNPEVNGSFLKNI